MISLKNFINQLYSIQFLTINTKDVSTKVLNSNQTGDGIETLMQTQREQMSNHDSID